MKQTLFAFILLGALSAQAQVQFGEIASAGTGCTAQDPLPRLEIENGKGKLSLSSLNVISNSKNSLINREVCNVRLQATVAAGHQLGIRIKNVVGSLTQARGVSTTVLATASLALDQDRQSLTQTWESKTKGKFKLENKVGDITWTTCSSQDVSTLLALSASASSVRNAASATANASVKEVNFEVLVRACE